MPNVETARGPVDTSELGRTYMHEHVFVLTPEVQQNYPEQWGSEDDRVADAVSKLKALAAQGIRSIADPTVIGLGRYIPRIQRIAAEVPELNIIPATGCYTYDQVPWFFFYRGPALSAALGYEVPDPMVDMFVGDITNGIAGTEVKAAFLKCAIDHQGMTDGVARVMRAVARAHRQTGAPITVHTHPGSHTGFDVRKLLCGEEGVDPTRVVLGHSGDTGDLDYLTELADDGFILGMDRFGVNIDTTFESRADTVAELCRRGYADRMVLAHDAACYIDWIDPNILAVMATQWHYLHIGDDVLPYLREQGVSGEQIDTMLVDVPRRYFENTTAY
jgi:phosphotriesterase-related protein